MFIGYKEEVNWREDRGEEVLKEVVGYNQSLVRRTDLLVEDEHLFLRGGREERKGEEREAHSFIQPTLVTRHQALS